jgi:hypothetical protein
MFFLLVAAEGQRWLWRARFEASCMGKDNNVGWGNVGWAMLVGQCWLSRALSPFAKLQARLGAPKRVNLWKPTFQPNEIREENAIISYRFDRF